MRVATYGHTRVVHVAPDGPSLASPDDVRDLMGDAWGADATWIAVPVARLDPAFFALRSGLAGEVAQLLQNYGLRLAVVGDVEEHVAASTAFRDYVRETARGRGSVRFVADGEELRAAVDGPGG